MPLINLVWSGATDLENSITGYELSYTTNPDILNASWISVAFIPTAQGYGSYSFPASQNINHYFRIRTKDNAQNFSEYKFLEVPLTSIYYISTTSQAPLIGMNACELAIPDFALIAGTTINVGDVLMYDDTNSVLFFDGTRSSTTGTSGFLSRLWKVLTPSLDTYTLAINKFGVIESSSICGDGSNSGLSSLASSSNNVCNLDVIFGNYIYWQYTLIEGIDMFSDDTRLIPLNPGYYRLLHLSNGNQYDSIISVGIGGVLLTKNKYNLVCGFTPNPGTNPGTNPGINPGNQIIMDPNSPLPNYEQNEGLFDI